MASAWSESRKWNERFMRLAHEVASWSKDPSTKVGAVIVGPARDIVSVGYNGMPRGVDDTRPERNSREAGEKYHWYEHAERNALYNALRGQRSVTGCVMYVTLFPCPDCARGIIQSGIAQLIHEPYDADHERYGDMWKRTATMLSEAGVPTKAITPPL